ncbi:hypothetical protein D3C72_1022710 [compost metagenome]
MDQLPAEEDDVIARRARDGNGQKAGRTRREGARLRDQRPDVIRREHAACGRAVQRAHDATEILQRGRLAGKGVVAAKPYADAVGRYGMGEDVCEPVRILQQGFVRRHGPQQLIGNIPSATFVLDGLLTFAAFQAHGEHLGEQLADRPPLEGGASRGVVMAGEQTPELAVHDDGNRQRGADTHVLEILDVDR